VKINRYIISSILIVSLLAATLLVGCTGKTATSTTPTRVYSIVQSDGNYRPARREMGKLPVTADSPGRRHFPHRPEPGGR